VRARQRLAAPTSTEIAIDTQRAMPYHLGGLHDSSARSHLLVVALIVVHFLFSGIPFKQNNDDDGTGHKRAMGAGLLRKRLPPWWIAGHLLVTDPQGGRGTSASIPKHLFTLLHGWPLRVRIEQFVVAPSQAQLAHRRWAIARARSTRGCDLRFLCGADATGCRASLAAAVVQSVGLSRGTTNQRSLRGSGKHCA
jgi:hypothetical protein